MQDQPASCTRVDAARSFAFPRDLPKYLRKSQWEGYSSINVQEMVDSLSMVL